MKRVLFAVIFTICTTSFCIAADYWRKASTDCAYPVILVDATDGYSAETEKKAADTTITYCNITDGNTPSSYTDSATEWKEIGDGTGSYLLLIGASEFTTADKDWFVKVVVSGCRTVRFTVHTLVGTPGNMATTDDGGTINVATGVVDADVDAWSLAPVSVATIFSDAISGGGFADIGGAVRYYLGAAIADVNSGSVYSNAAALVTSVGNLQTDFDNTIGTPAVSVSADIAALAATSGSYLTTSVAAGASTTSFTLAAGPTTDNWFGVCQWKAVVIDATNSMPGSAFVLSYTGSSKTVTLSSALPFTPAASDVVYFIPSTSSTGGWIGQ